jgi:hypothetical protein
MPKIKQPKPEKQISGNFGKDKKRLDKLEQLTPTTTDKDFSSLTRRANSKYIQEKWLQSLAALDSPLRKNYTFALRCSQVITQTGKKFTAKYCGNRFCLICNRIRTGQLINGYEKTLDNLKDKRFVTLTRPNVKAENLKEEINTYYNIWRKITREAVKKKLLFNGVRKLEITYNPTRNDFHPHFHLIIETKEAADWVLAKWLEHCPESSPEAQKEVHCSGYKEIFKYVTKITTKTSKAKNAKASFYPYETDLIFQALKGARIFQPFGTIKKLDVSEEIETKRAMIIETATEQDAVFSWYKDDWYNKKNEPLTDFVPTKKQDEYRARIVFRNLPPTYLDRYRNE